MIIFLFIQIVHWMGILWLVHFSFFRLKPLKSMKLEHPLIPMVMRNCVVLNVANKDIIFCCVPSHTGIRGNEMPTLLPSLI